MTKDKHFDNLKLIKEFKKHRLLWDNRHVHFHQNNEKRLAWITISNVMDAPESVCRNKYKNLRDTFRREYKKEIVHNKKSIWRYLQHLLFLAPYLELHLRDGADTSKIVERDEEEEEEEEGEADEQLMSEDEVDNYTYDKNGIVLIDENKLAERSNDDENSHKEDELNEDEKFIKEDYYDVEALEASPQHVHPEPVVNTPDQRKKIKLETTERLGIKEDDDDLYFFMSLIPYMKKFGPLKRLKLRSKIQNVIVTELEMMEEKPLT